MQKQRSKAWQHSVLFQTDPCRKQLWQGKQVCLAPAAGKRKPVQPRAAASAWSNHSHWAWGGTSQLGQLSPQQPRRKKAQERRSSLEALTPSPNLPTAAAHCTPSHDSSGEVLVTLANHRKQMCTTSTTSKAVQGTGQVTWPGVHRLWPLTCILCQPGFPTARQPSPCHHQQLIQLPNPATIHLILGNGREHEGGKKEVRIAPQPTSSAGTCLPCSQEPGSTRARKTRAHQRPVSPVLLPRKHPSKHAGRESWEAATAQGSGEVTRRAALSCTHSQ